MDDPSFTREDRLGRETEVKSHDRLPLGRGTMTGGQVAVWLSIGLAAATLLGILITYLVSAGTKARRDMLEQDVTDLEKRLANRERELAETRHERDTYQAELEALGRVVTAAAAIDRFERALAAHRTELIKRLDDIYAFLQRIHDLIVSFRTGGRRD